METVGKSPQPSGYGQGMKVEAEINHESRFWKKAKDLVLAEFYTDFVPRWFKEKSPEVPNHKSKSLIGSISPGMKLGIGTGLSLLTAFNFGDYQVILGGLGIYLMVDGIYQLFDLKHPYCKDLRRAATWAVDALTYPFYLIFLRTRHE
ncbi:MAG: hypothetical protein KAV87_03860 [Desulfobacteraceae bacterium]|nr:hypothetical protein [Desulfobacteraceae bacterium]